MITPRSRLLVSCLIATVPILLAAQDTAPRETVLNHVSVIDVTGGAVQPDMAVLIRGDRIAAIERAAGFSRPGARVIDLTGKFLMPGLADMHNHLERGESMPGPPTSGQTAERDVRGNLKQMLAWGVTTVFSTSHANVDLREFGDLRRAAVTDSAFPRFFGVGRVITVAGGHVSQPRFAGYLPGSVDEARANVREMQAAAVDAIKLIYADQAHTGRTPVAMMQAEVMRAVIDEAHKLGLKAYVHAPGLRQAKEVLRAGADGLVHSVADAPLDDEFIALMKKNRAMYTTTLSLYTASQMSPPGCSVLQRWIPEAAAQGMYTQSINCRKWRRPITRLRARFLRKTCDTPRATCGELSMREFPSWQARTRASSVCLSASRVRWRWFFWSMPG